MKASNTDFRCYRHACVADLAWVIQSPMMIRQPKPCVDFVYTEEGLLQAWLDELDADPEPLRTYLDQHSQSHFLGAYFENLWCFYLDWHPRYTPVARNLQIVDAGRTLGEFDVLLYDNEAGYHIHQELAVKFYLGVSEKEDQAERVRWIGPNRNDRLDQKYHELCDRQIRLSENPVALSQLNELGIGNLKKQCIFKGYLFQPFNQALPYPDYVLQGCGKGGWIGFDRFLQVLQDTVSSSGEKTTDYWQMLGKREWFSSKCYESLGQQLLSTEALQQALSSIDQKRCLMLVCLSGSKGGYSESRRLMLTPSGWESGGV